MRGAGVRQKSLSRLAHRPTLASQGKSLTMSDLVLETEAKAAEEAKKQLALSKPSWLAKGRSVQNLNRFVKTASQLASESREEREDLRESASEAERWARRGSERKDGSAVAITAPRI